jgi:hypothetical protein
MGQGFEWLNGLESAERADYNTPDLYPLGRQGWVVEGKRVVTVDAFLESTVELSIGKNPRLENADPGLFPPGACRGYLSLKGLPRVNPNPEDGRQERHHRCEVQRSGPAKMRRDVGREDRRKPAAQVPAHIHQAGE